MEKTAPDRSGFCSQPAALSAAASVERYVFVSNSPSVRLVTNPETMDPLTFSAVRPISISGSIEINTPAKATGRFIVDRTIKEAKVAPPPTPATPNELIMTTTINVAMKDGDSGLMPWVGAIMTASMAG